MADAKKGNKAKEFFEKFGEKLALGVCLLILIGYAVVAFGMSSEDPGIGQMEKNIKSIKKEESTLHTDMVAPNIESWQAKAINPWNTVVASARPADEWTGSIITKAEGKGLPKQVIKKVPVLVPPVVFSGTEIAIDSVTVGWSYKDFTRQEEQKMARDKENKTDAAKATHFLLERQVAGGKWEVVSDKLDVKTQSYVDVKIEPKTKYAYRITAFSTDKNYLERGGKVDEVTGATPNPDGKINTVTSPTISTMGIWNLSFTNATKLADAAKGMVYVKIEKFEKGVGKVEAKHIHYDGDQIGFWSESEGAEPVSKHRVSNKGKSILVDFNMGATLVSVTPVKLPIEVKRCKPIYDKSTGNKTGCDTIIEKRSFDTAAIIYRDDEGQKKMYFPNPSLLDQLCEEHGGKKIIVTRPDSNESASPEPKVDPKEAAKAKRESEAEKLFDEAEKALDKNKGLAQSCYTRLLREYADTDFVGKSKKATIEERLAGLQPKKGK
jgi:hypothetical protein